MSKTHQYLQEQYSEFPLNRDIDDNKDLSTFKKLKNKIEKNKELEKIYGLIQEDFSNIGTFQDKNEISYLFFYIKSFISIFGLQFVFLLLKKQQTLKEMEIISTSKGLSPIFSDIFCLISEKIKDLAQSNLNFEEIRHFFSVKPSKKEQNQKKPRFLKLSSFDEILIEGMILQKKVEQFLGEIQTYDSPRITIEFLKEIDNYQSKLIYAATTISAQENQILKEISLKNKSLMQDLQKLQEQSQKIPIISKKPNLPLKSRTFLRLNDSLPLEDLEIEYKNYHFPLSQEQIDRLENCICAFLNTNGGRIFLGVKDEDNRVVGIRLDLFKKEQALRDLQNLISNLKPPVNQNQWKIIYLPVKNDFDKHVKSLYVIKLIIKKADTFLHCNSDNKYFKRRDGKVKMLQTDEVKQELIKKKENPVENEKNEDFDDPIPAEEDNYYYDNYNKFNNNFNPSYSEKKQPKYEYDPNYQQNFYEKDDYYGYDHNDFNNYNYYDHDQKNFSNYHNNFNNYSNKKQHYYIYVPKKDDNSASNKNNNSINFAPAPIPENKNNKIDTDLEVPNLNVNRKILSLNVEYEANENENEYMFVVSAVKNLLLEFLNLKIEKVLLLAKGFQKKRECFFEFENEIEPARKKEIFQIINDNIDSFRLKSIKIQNFDYVEKKKYEKCLKLLKIKINS